jgi:hypothetical protein
MNPMRKSYFALYSIVLITASLAVSQTTSPSTTIQDPRAKQACAAVDQVEPPARDRPTATEEKALGSCVSLDAYYGLGEPADLVKARKCAFAEMDRGEKRALSGKAILSMIYANGKGVDRNYDYAIKMACTIGDAAGDGAGRVYQLLRIKKENPAGEGRYSVCDHSSGRDLYEQCAILTSRFDKIERDENLEKFIAKWSEHDKKAFHVFWPEEEKFAKIQATNGVDLEGTFEIQEEVFIMNNMVDALEKFEQGELPKHTADEAHTAQAAEAAEYEKTQNGSVAKWDTITREGVKTSEDAWRHYRSAWLAFAEVKYPAVSADSWATWLDQERTTALTKFAH